MLEHCYSYRINLDFIPESVSYCNDQQWREKLILFDYQSGKMGN